jgi:hypothetical protein
MSSSSLSSIVIYLLPFYSNNRMNKLTYFTFFDGNMKAKKRAIPTFKYESAKANRAAQSAPSEPPPSQSTAQSSESGSNNSYTSANKTSSTVPREEQPRDPWRIGLGTWYSPAIKRRATIQQIAERDAALHRHTCSTPLSLPYPSTEVETQLMTEMLQKIESTSPTQFGAEILPYWNAILYFKQLISDETPRGPLPEPTMNLQLPATFNSLHRLTPPSDQPSTHSELSDLVLLSQIHDIIPDKALKFSTMTETQETENSSTFLTLNQARMLADSSQEALAQLLPAMVEANVYYAAEVLTVVLKERGALELAETIVSHLNPRQTTALLPAMCRVNPTWREDGFFDLMVEVLSTGGILRWEPADVAQVIGNLPKVAISTEYYTSPEFDPTNPSNENKTPAELLKAAQKMAKEQYSLDARWDRSSYGLPGDFLLTPSKEDVEKAKREYEDLIRSTEDWKEISASEEPPKPHPTTEIRSNSEQVKRDEDDILAFLDVSHSVAPEIVADVSALTIHEPAYYNPIAWQPEEIGRLVGTMLSQELELDDIVEVLSDLAIKEWQDEAKGAPWHTYMGYFATVVSDALTANKHWVDEDYNWVIHDVITNVGPWALRQWPDYRTDEHQKWLAEMIAQTAIKYGRFKHDYRLIQIVLNMVCDNWPENEHQKLSDLIEMRMRDRTYVGRAGNWFKWRIQGQYKQRFSDQRAAQSQLWIAPYNVGENPKLPELVNSQGLRDPTLVEKIKKAITETEDDRFTAPSRTGTKPNNELIW